MIRSAHCWKLFAVLLLISIGAGSASAAATGNQAAVDAVVKKLTEEANAAFKTDSLQSIDAGRPHGLVNTLGEDDVFLVVRAMTTRFTGDNLKDTYIRYHLMYVVNQVVNNGHGDAKLAAALRQLEASLPQDIKVEDKPWSTYDHPDIAGKYQSLINQCYVSVGYPPFVRSVGPPESFQYMDPGQKAHAQEVFAEAQKLETQFKRIDLPANGAYNSRAGIIKWIIRDYRGEVLYALIGCGDKAGLTQMADAIQFTAGKDLERATDLASFLNAAYFNGMLSKFSKDELKPIAAQLKQAVALATPHAAGEKPPARNAAPPENVLGGWVSLDGRQRRLGDELFTLISALDSTRLPAPVDLAHRVRNPDEFNAPPAPPAPAEAPAATQPVQIKPDDITLTMIDAAIERGVTALDRFRPPDEDLGANSYTSQNGATAGYFWKGNFSPTGNIILNTWAMLGVGEPPQNAWLQRRINWMLCCDTPNTYDRAMRLQMMSMISNRTIDPWIKHDTQWLMDTMTDDGNWGESNTGGKPTGVGDNANGQYAVLGLWAAQQSGQQIPEQYWKKIDSYWREAQHDSGPGAGGWSTVSKTAVKAGSNDFKGLVTAPMTAGGCLSLFLTEMYLYGPKRVELGQSLSPELLSGLKWLDENMSLDKIDGDSDFYFYAWTLQNVGETTGYRKFNNIDWFREVTARLLNTQLPDGTWTGPKSTNVSTSFALLYLARARGPLAICKVRFGSTGRGGAWDNRPNDIYNLAGDIGHRFETPTSWQIADLDQPVYQLIESPLLYLATDKEFTLTPEQVQRLKQYVDAGGLLICVPEGPDLKPATASMKALAEQLCPGIEPAQRTDLSDPFFSLVAKMKKAIPLISYDSAVRPRVVIVDQDLGRELQADNPAERSAFDLLANIYMYVSGRNPSRARIDPSFITQHKDKPTTPMTVARVKCDGDFDPEPGALPQLKAMMADRNDIDLHVAAIDPADLTAQTKIAFLTASIGAKLSDENAAVLRKWVDAGGTLWVDAAGGTEDALGLQNKLLKQLNVDEEALMPTINTAIMTGQGLAGGSDNTNPAYRAFRKERPPVMALMIKNRPAILVLRGDLVSGLAGLNDWGIMGLTPQSARQIAGNSVLMVATPAGNDARDQAIHRAVGDDADWEMIFPISRDAQRSALRSILNILFQARSVTSAR